MTNYMVNLVISWASNLQYNINLRWNHFQDNFAPEEIYLTQNVQMGIRADENFIAILLAYYYYWRQQ